MPVRDTFLPVVCLDYGGKHDEVRFNNLVCDGVVWVNNGEADVPMVGFVWNFRSRPIWFVCENYVSEEGVRVLDFLQKLFLGPKLAHVHSVAVDGEAPDLPFFPLKHMVAICLVASSL